MLNEIPQRGKRVLRSFAVASAFIAAACAAATLQPRDYEIVKTTKTAYKTVAPITVQYTVQPGDCLWNITKQQLHASTNKEVIAAVKLVVQNNQARLPYLNIDNKSFSGNNPDGIPGDYLKQGDTLVIGELPSQTIAKNYTSFSYTPIQPSDDALLATAGVAVCLAGIAAATSTVKRKQEPHPVNPVANPLEKAIDLYYGRYDKGLKPEVSL